MHRTRRGGLYIRPCPAILQVPTRAHIQCAPTPTPEVCHPSRFSNFSLCFNRRDFVKNFSTGTVHCGMFPVEIPAPFYSHFPPVERSKFVHKGVWRRSPCNSWLCATFPHKIVLLLLLLHISSLSIREKDCKCADLPGGCGKPGGTKEAHL